MSWRDRIGELALLGIIAGGILWILDGMVKSGKIEYDFAAFIAVLMAVVNQIGTIWQGQALHGSVPSASVHAPGTSAANPMFTERVNPEEPQPVEVVNEPGNPVPTTDEPDARPPGTSP